MLASPIVYTTQSKTANVDVEKNGVGAESERRGVPVYDLDDFRVENKSGCWTCMEKTSTAYTYRVRVIVFAIFLVLALIILCVRNNAGSSEGQDHVTKFT